MKKVFSFVVGRKNLITLYSFQNSNFTIVTERNSQNVNANNEKVFLKDKVENKVSFIKHKDKIPQKEIGIKINENIQTNQVKDKRTRKYEDDRYFTILI